MQTPCSMDAVEISRVLPSHVDYSTTARCQLRRGEWLSGPVLRAWTAPVLVVICKPGSLVDLVKFNQGMIVSSYIIFPSIPCNRLRSHPCSVVLTIIAALAGLKGSSQDVAYSTRPSLAP